MDFGRVDYNELDKVDFTLPGEPASNARVLAKGDGSFDFRFGASKWSRKDWVGSLYPKGTTEDRFLDEYVKRFNYIELGATFYNIPQPDQLALWGKKAEGHDIIFNIKMSRQITHVKRFKDCNSDLTAFFNAIPHFGSQLGRIWMQTSDNLPLKGMFDILNVLQSLPSQYQYFIEFRSKELFGDIEFLKDLTDLLSAKDIGFIITDTAGRRDAVHMALTVPETMIRFIGNGSHQSEISRLKDWIVRIKYWRDSGIEKVYFCYDQHEDKGYAQHYQNAEKLFIEAGLLGN